MYATKTSDTMYKYINKLVYRNIVDCLKYLHQLDNSLFHLESVFLMNIQNFL